MNMDRGICVANNAISPMSSMNLCLLFDATFVDQKVHLCLQFLTDPRVILTNNHPAWKR